MISCIDTCVQGVVCKQDVHINIDIQELLSGASFGPMLKMWYATVVYLYMINHSVFPYQLLSEQMFCIE